ncbi:hypothetical protein, partial [Thiolapillus sp.]|uniref:hypothetical protein n=1 Tax=Thiolapillus sp. TaxID=2017437 RepID=UPI003AF9BB57
AGCSNQRIEQALTGSMNKIATLFHPKIYGGTMLLTLNSSHRTFFNDHIKTRICKADEPCRRRWHAPHIGIFGSKKTF